ncbi:hypothetical protein Taro_043716 [Colocasia esculenta]|uniref:Uncharacterized protein n=1 Tax=Colocasia esculenta TaxID=4460 RepID=A0A843WS39_COLES|nr:hypothetical protein [Colocasia esculenta]
MQNYLSKPYRESNLDSVSFYNYFHLPCCVGTIDRLIGPLFSNSDPQTQLKNAKLFAQATSGVQFGLRQFLQVTLTFPVVLESLKN